PFFPGAYGSSSWAAVSRVCAACSASRHSWEVSSRENIPSAWEAGRTSTAPRSCSSSSKGFCRSRRAQSSIRCIGTTAKTFPPPFQHDLLHSLGGLRLPALGQLFQPGLLLGRLLQKGCLTPFPLCLGSGPKNLSALAGFLLGGVLQLLSPGCGLLPDLLRLAPRCKDSV